MRYLCSLLCLTFCLLSDFNSLAQTAKNASPKNIILLIGDGMGLSQVSSAYYFGEGTPNFSRFPYIGLSNTSAASDKITDSAAGATAFASGVLTYNAAIGVDNDSVPVPTIVEQLSKEGLSTGLVATSSITHATPAAFYAHVKSRNQHEDIAAQLVASPVDFFAGGGKEFFFNRKDQTNYYDSLSAHGFVIDTTALNRPNKLDSKKRYGFLLADDGMPRMLDGRGDFLAKATKMALDHLSQDKDGFFLMVEGSQIDWGGHANDAAYLISELLDFDQTLGVALDFAKQHKNTLVIVTADHETGGYALSSTIEKQGMSADYNEITPTFSTGGHTATLVPVFAYGPGAERFAGVYKNTAIYDKMRALTKKKRGSSAERE